MIGTGFVGAVTSAVFASLGHTVFAVNRDESKTELFRKGKVPFYEPGLEELILAGVQKGKLRFTTNYEEAVPSSDIVMIAVGTPSAEDGNADLSQVFASAEKAAPLLKDGAILVVKSTVPPGTNSEVSRRVAAITKVSFTMASLPEYLREGTAVQDTLHPDRVVIGAVDPRTIKILTDLHTPLTENILVMRPESAQMCKYAANAYLATRITFINQIANLCEVNGADIEEVIRGIGEDRRIGSHYWFPGVGYGGSCFPKDVRELSAYARSIGLTDNLMITINDLNERRMSGLFELFTDQVGGWEGKKVAVLGLSFKPNTDDLREAPSLKIVPLLQAQNAVVVGYDPMAKDAAVRTFSANPFPITDSIDEAIQDADVVMVLVEWREFSGLEPSYFSSKIKKNGWIIDTRNIYAHRRKEFHAQGLQYRGIGVV